MDALLANLPTAALTAALAPYLAYAMGVLALALLLPYLDRLRVMNFATHRRSVVGMHLAWALWLGWVAYYALIMDDCEAHQLFGLLGAGLWLATSRPTWRHGPPEHTASSPVPLDTQPIDIPLSQPAAARRGNHHQESRS